MLDFEISHILGDILHQFCLSLNSIEGELKQGESQDMPTEHNNSLTSIEGHIPSEI